MNTWFGQDFLFTMVFIGHLLEIALFKLYVFGMNEMYFVRLEEIWKKSLLLDVILIMPLTKGEVFAYH